MMKLVTFNFFKLNFSLSYGLVYLVWSGRHCKPHEGKEKVDTSDYIDEDKLDLLEDHKSISYRI